MAMRVSSAQSISSGLLVTRPSLKAASASSAWPSCARHGVQRRLLAVEAPLQPALPGDHRIDAEIGFAHGDLRRTRLVVGQRQVVAAVARQRQFEEAAGEARAGLR